MNRFEQKSWDEIDRIVMKETEIKYRRSHNVEDIVQAARIAAYGEFEKSKGKLGHGELIAYCRQAGRYAARDEYRRLKRQEEPLPPEPPAKKKRHRVLSVRVDEDLASWLDFVSKEEDKTISDLILERLQQARIEFINNMRKIAGIRGLD